MNHHFNMHLRDGNNFRNMMPLRQNIYPFSFSMCPPFSAPGPPPQAIQPFNGVKNTGNGSSSFCQMCEFALRCPKCNYVA